jgi:hypothetical protein
MRLASSRTLSALLALFLGLGAAGAARADAAYVLTLAGTYDHSPDCWETSDLCTSGPPAEVTGAWSGNLTVDVDSGADGTYDQTQMSMLLSANLGSFDSHDFFIFPFMGTVTVAGGRVTSIDASYDYSDDPEVFLVLDGLSASYDQPAMHHYGATLASGTLLSAPVPEPRAWLLMAGGLAALAASARPRAFSRGPRAAA